MTQIETYIFPHKLASSLKKYALELIAKHPPRIAQLKLDNTIAQHCDNLWRSSDGAAMTACQFVEDQPYFGFMVKANLERLGLETLEQMALEAIDSSLPRNVITFQDKRVIRIDSNIAYVVLSHQNVVASYGNASGPNFYFPPDTYRLGESIVNKFIGTLNLLLQVGEVANGKQQ